MTTEELKLWLSTPLALFILMLLASVLSAWKQIGDSKNNGAAISWSEYFSHAPETATMLISNAIGFAILIYTDQLNFASALGLGYVSNSASDLIRSGGRSLAVSGLTNTDVEEKK